MVGIDPAEIKSGKLRLLGLICSKVSTDRPSWSEVSRQTVEVIAG